MDIVLRPWRHYFDFDGRSRRTEFVLFHLLIWLVIVALFVAGGMLSEGYASSAGEPAASPAGAWAIGVMALFWLVSLIPMLALSVRRLHDQDLSGLWLLLTVVPLAGFIIGLMMLFVGGSSEANQYGEDPRGRDVEEMANTFR